MDRAAAVSSSSAASAVTTSIAVVAGVDLLTKAAVAAAIPLHAAVAVDRTGWLVVRHEENCGGAGGLIPRFPLAVYIAALVVTFWQCRDGDPGTAAIAGGALGNVASLAATLGPTGLRLTTPSLLGIPAGCVTDWIQLGTPLLGGTPGTGAPVFNLADLAIITGAIVLRRGEPTSAAGWAGVTGLAALALVGIGLVLHALRMALLGR
jgi:lipoprotein signal peptidase